MLFRNLRKITETKRHRDNFRFAPQPNLLWCRSISVAHLCSGILICFLKIFHKFSYLEVFRRYYSFILVIITIVVTLEQLFTIFSSTNCLVQIQRMKMLNKYMQTPPLHVSKTSCRRSQSRSSSSLYYGKIWFDGAVKKFWREEAIKSSPISEIDSQVFFYLN